MTSPIQSTAGFELNPARDAVSLAELLLRYSGASPTALKAVLCPLLIPLKSLDKTITREGGGTHHRAKFTITLTPENTVVLVRGRTGKFVGSAHAGGGAWKELAKGRITDIDETSGEARGEIYFGSTRTHLEDALLSLDETCLLEIDQFGASAKVLSGLAEYYLMQKAESEGYSVRRMPEDMARHLGEYANYDFEFEKDGQKRKIEVKSLWGTNTKCARLIHSKTKGHKTSSCKFSTQDIFAVSLFLRTGNITDFAFARSVPQSSERPYGLPIVPRHPDHVTQNPECRIDNGSWFAAIGDVWNLD